MPKLEEAQIQLEHEMEDANTQMVFDELERAHSTEYMEGFYAGWNASAESAYRKMRTIDAKLHITYSDTPDESTHET